MRVARLQLLLHARGQQLVARGLFYRHHAFLAQRAHLQQPPLRRRHACARKLAALTKGLDSRITTGGNHTSQRAHCSDRASRRYTVTVGHTPFWPTNATGSLCRATPCNFTASYGRSTCRTCGTGAHCLRQYRNVVMPVVRAARAGSPRGLGRQTPVVSRGMAGGPPQRGAAPRRSLWAAEVGGPQTGRPRAPGFVAALDPNQLCTQLPFSKRHGLLLASNSIRCFVCWVLKGICCHTFSACGLSALHKKPCCSSPPCCKQLVPNLPVALHCRRQRTQPYTLDHIIP